MEHIYGRVSEWNIYMAEFQNGNQNLKIVAFPKEANVFICIHTAHGNIMFRPSSRASGNTQD